MSQQVAALLAEFNQAVKSREEELAIVEQGNFTSDEEDMGITPSHYDRENKLKKREQGKSSRQHSIATLGQHPKIETAVVRIGEQLDQNETPTP